MAAMPSDSVEEPSTKGSVKRTGLRLGVKELRTELYRALPITVSRATKVFYGETTKRASEASVLSVLLLSPGLMGLRANSDVSWSGFMFRTGGLDHRADSGTSSKRRYPVSPVAEHAA
jgi:hypothetical protein